MESLARQVNSMNYIAKQKRQDIRKLEKSDLAASIAELEEETNIFFLEIERLEKEKKDSARDLAQISQKADILLTEYSDDNFEKLEQSIAALQRQIEIEKKQNSEFENKIKQIKETNDFIAKTRGHPELQKEIRELQQQVKAKQKEIHDHQDIIDEISFY